MSTPLGRGLPPRIYLPLFLVLAVAFLAAMGYFLRIGFGVTGSTLGPGANEAKPATVQQPQNVQVGGGPPPAVQAQLGQLRAQIAAHPHDDVALVQLGDLYLAVQKYAQAVPLYKQALAANPNNVAAKAGLEEANNGLAEARH
ncbi:MAG: hypothetical protein M3N19_06525 [Candidatus Eremiobacteraeota bacterium]|nr:hypothetical protein [Candidatus Eremiobacteraeota bacterium]